MSRLRPVYARDLLITGGYVGHGNSDCAGASRLNIARKENATFTKWLFAFPDALAFKDSK
jgi:hypothetical protein